MTALMSTGCSQVNFSPGQEAVLKNNAFADGEEDREKNPEDQGNRGQTPEDGGKGKTPEEYLGNKEVQFPIQRECSDGDTQKAGNVQLAQKVVLRVFKGNKVICEDLQTNFKNDLTNLEMMTVNLSGCTLYDDQHYDIRFFDESKLSRNEELGEVRVEVQKGNLVVKDKRLEIVYASNPNSSRVEGTSEDFTRCDSFSSPLVIKMGTDPIRLSSPTDGILFDIQGENSNHVKKQISWPVDDAVAFIALPNEEGRVLGINELFGDNTKGNDGRFSAHGYEALAKYDDNYDGVIDGKDAVFSKLRLFFDRNRDGESQVGELVALSSKGIESIDLAFDATYAEKDKYGNKILFKSLARTQTGYLLVFDIWFRLID